MVAAVEAFALEQGIAEVLIEVRRISHPGWSRLEVAARLGPALIVWGVVVGEVVVGVVIHAVDIVSFGGISPAEKHTQAQDAGQKQRRAASEHV